MFATYPWQLVLVIINLLVGISLNKIINVFPSTLLDVMAMIIALYHWKSVNPIVRDKSVMFCCPLVTLIRF